MSIVLIDSGMGVLPFIKEILLQKKKNHYIIYLDEENFPYGNKDCKEIFLCYKNIIKKVKEFNADKIFIACNTLSTFKDDESILDILSYNINHNKNSYYVCTNHTALYLKSKGINSVIPMKNLAFYIENNDIKNIIKLLKETKFPSSIILACTHYPLIKDLFIKYTKSEVISYEKEIVSSFEDKESLVIDFYTNKKDKYKNYFKNININFISSS